MTPDGQSVLRITTPNGLVTIGGDINISSRDFSSQPAKNIIGLFQIQGKSVRVIFLVATSDLINQISVVDALAQQLLVYFFSGIKLLLQLAI